MKATVNASVPRTNFSGNLLFTKSTCICSVYRLEFVIMVNYGMIKILFE